jgi:hypothetical protein
MTNYVRDEETGVCECPSTTHDVVTIGIELTKCKVKCSGNTPVRDSSSGDCRGYVCADNGDETNSMLDMYEAGKTLTLPSNKCYFPTDCIVDLGYEISGTNCICAPADTYSWTSLNQIPGTPKDWEIAEGGRCDKIPVCSARGTGKQLD